MTTPLLEVQGLKVAYGGIQAVKGVSFEVREGELVSLIGANGVAGDRRATASRCTHATSMPTAQ